MRPVGVVLAVAVLAVAGGAALIRFTNESSPPGSSPAGSWFLAPNGSDANACTRAAPCRTLQRGFDVAEAGDTVFLAAGAYPGGQTLIGSKAVTFALDPKTVIGAISGRGQLNVKASGVTFRGGRIPAVALQGSPVSSDDTFRNVDGGRIWIDNASSNIAWRGGGLGPNKCSGGAVTYLNTIQNASHITFDGVRFHGQALCSSGEHTESLRIDQGSSFVTVKNSSFSNNDDTTSAIFITTQSKGKGMPSNITITGNTFNADGSGRRIQTQDPNVTTCKNFTITNNRSTPAGSSFLLLLCPTQRHVVTRNNTAF